MCIRDRPTELSFHMMQLAAVWSSSNPFAASENPVLFNKHVGSTSWWDEINLRGARARVDSFVDQWVEQARNFQQQAKRFWIYR